MKNHSNRQKKQKMLIENESVFNIGYFNRVRYFSLQQASEILPLVIKITRQAVYVNHQHEQILCHKDLRSDFLHQVKKEQDEFVNAWRLKLEKLGIITGDFATAMFDTGHGYLLWRYPQSGIREFMHYESDAGNAIDIEKVKHHHPHWLNTKLNVPPLSHKSVLRKVTQTIQNNTLQMPGTDEQSKFSNNNESTEPDELENSAGLPLSKDSEVLSG